MACLRAQEGDERGDLGGVEVIKHRYKGLLGVLRRQILLRDEPLEQLQIPGGAVEGAEGRMKPDTSAPGSQMAPFQSHPSGYGLADKTCK